MSSATFKKVCAGLTLFITLYLVAYLYLFITGSLFCFGEAVSYEGLLRVLNGLKFATSPTEIPLSLTPYTPVFLTPLIAIGKLLGITQIEHVSLMARIYQTGLLFVFFLFLNLIRERFFSNLSSRLSFLCVVLIVFFYSPTMELALRPDTLSFLCEAASLFYILRFLRYSATRNLALASIFSGLAIALKLNTVGAAVGIIVFLILNKNLKNLIIYSLGLWISALFFLGVQYLILGDILTTNIFQSIQSTILSSGDAIKVYIKLFDLFLLPLSYYIFLVVYGVARLPQRKERTLFALVLSFSFLFAFVGQMKWGAFHNYFLGVLYLGLMPASIAFTKITETKNTSQLIGSFLFYLFYITLLIIRGTSVPIKIWQDKNYFTELKQLRLLLKEKTPQGLIYTNNEQLQLAFADRTAIGVLSQELLETTPTLQKHIEPLKAKIKSLPLYSSYIINCEAYESGKSSWTFINLEDFKKRTLIKTGRFCVFY